MVTTSTPRMQKRNAESGQKPIAIGQAIEKFVGRADSKFTLGSFEDYNFAMLALREYINSFVSALLRSQGAVPSIATRPNKEVVAYDEYEPSVASLEGIQNFLPVT